MLSLGKRNPRPEASMASTLVQPFPPKFGPHRLASLQSSCPTLPIIDGVVILKGTSDRSNGWPTVENGCNHLLKHATSLAPSCRFCKVKSQLLGSQNDFHGHPSLGLQIASDGPNLKPTKSGPKMSFCMIKDIQLPRNRSKY